MNINATGIIFSNIHDEELHEITTKRTMGAVPFCGSYHLIDFALSNMRNSFVESVGVIAKNNYQSLIDYVKSGKEWDMSRKRGGLFIFPPFGRLHSGYYNNKIEALFGILTFIKDAKTDYFVITDCDIICNFNWKIPLEYHILKKADITIIYFNENQKHDPSVKETVYSISDDGYVNDIQINQHAKPNDCIGSNMWIISKDFLIAMIEDATAHNLENIERDIMQKKLMQYKIAAWKYKGYINKINSIFDYYCANMNMLNQSIREDLFYKHGHIYTKVEDDIPTRFGSNAKVSNSLIADGCLIEGSIENSIIFRNVHVGKGSIIRNSLILQSSTIGNNVNLNYVLSDTDVMIRDNCTLAGHDLYPFYIKQGSHI